MVVSGAPGTGKSVVAAALAEGLRFPLLSLDTVKEALGDSLGLGDEAWSDQLGDAAAEVIFTLAKAQPPAILEGWWRRERRDRVIKEFPGAMEVFCRCDGQLAEDRMRRRRAARRHPIHRDVINPTILDGFAEFSETVTPLDLGGLLIEVDTTEDVDVRALVARVHEALSRRERGSDSLSRGPAHE